MARLTLRPDDWHLHLRDGDIMASVLPDTARRFARAIVMPNLKPPVTAAAQAQAYRARILAALPTSMSFEPLMALHLTEAMPPEEIARAKASGAGIYTAHAAIELYAEVFEQAAARQRNDSVEAGGVNSYGIRLQDSTPNVPGHRALGTAHIRR